MTAPPLAAKANHQLETDSDTPTPTKKKQKTSDPSEDLFVKFDKELIPTKTPTSLNTEQVVYQSPMGTFTARFQRTTDAQVEAFWTNFQDHVQQARNSIDHDVFRSPLTQEDLNLLDMKSASYLFPTLVNNAGELRTRAEKAHKSDKDMLESLKDKKKTFNDISTSALKQANKIQDAICELEASMTKKAGAAAQKKVAEKCKTELSTKATLAEVIDAMPTQLNPSEFVRLSSTLADHVTSIAERYRQELLPMVMYIRKMASILAHDEHRLLQLKNLFSRMVRSQDENAKSYFWPKYLEAVVPEGHLCQCEKCKNQQSPTTAAEHLTKATEKVEPLVFPNEYDYRDPANVYRQPDLRLPDTYMSHQNLTATMREDLEYRYKGSKYSFQQYNALLDAAHEQYQSEIQTMIDYGKVLEKQEKEELTAQRARRVLAVNEAAANRERELKESQARDRKLSAAAIAAIDAYIAEEREAYKSLPTNQQDRNHLTLGERRARVDYNYQKEKAEIEWQTNLQYAEDIQGAFFDHVITDPREFEEIIRRHKESGNSTPPPLDRA